MIHKRKTTILFYFVFLFSLFLVSAMTETEVRDTICSDINLSASNCTTWWDGLNLTEVTPSINVTNLNITIVQGGNYTTTYSNFSTIENRTIVKNYYNTSGNFTEFNFTNAYTKSEVDSKVSGLITSSALTPYALKTELTNSTNTEIKDIEKKYKWIFWVINGVVFIIIGFLLYTQLVGE